MLSRGDKFCTQCCVALTLLSASTPVCLSGFVSAPTSAIPSISTVQDTPTSNYLPNSHYTGAHWEHQVTFQLKHRRNALPTGLFQSTVTYDDEVDTSSPPKSQSSTPGEYYATSAQASTPRYFNETSSVRSTTQTEALGKRERQPSSTAQTADSEKKSSSIFEDIPQEVLQPFSWLILSQFVLFLGVGAVIPTIPIYGQSIGLSSATNGLVISAPAVALLLMSRLAGEFADKARKPAMIGGMALIAVADVGTALSNSLATLLVARLGLGLGRGYAEAGERGMLTDLANKTPTLRGRALAVQQAAVALGIALGAPVGGIVVEEFGARAAFLCVSAAALLALGIYVTLPETVLNFNESNANDSNNNERKPNDAQEELEASKAKGSEADWIKLLSESSNWRGLATCQVGTSFGYACKIAVVPILAASLLPGGAAGAGILLSAAGMAALAGAPLGGWLSDKFGSRNAAVASGLASGASLATVPIGLSLSKFFETAAVAQSDQLADGTLSALDTGSSLASSVDFLHSALAGVGGPEAAAFAALILLWSVGASAQGPALIALAQELAPAGAEATALGLPRAAGDGTYIIAPLLLGYVSDAAGSTIPGAACAVAGGAMCVGSIALFFLSSSDQER